MRRSLLPIRTQPRHLGVVFIVLTWKIACSWRLQKGARRWRVELAKGEQNARFVRLIKSIVTRRDEARHSFSPELECPRGK